MRIVCKINGEIRSKRKAFYLIAVTGYNLTGRKKVGFSLTRGSDMCILTKPTSQYRYIDIFPWGGRANRNRFCKPENNGPDVRIAVAEFWANTLIPATGIDFP